MQWRAGTVIEQVRHWPGAVECTRGARRGPRHRRCARSPTRRWSATPQPGERVLLNASALLKGLGTGGLAFVVARPDHLPGRPAGRARATSSRRATRPLQQMLLARRRAGQPAPRRPRRRRRPGRDAGGRRRPALRAAGRAGRHPGGEPGRAGRVRDDRRRGAARGLLARRGRAGGCRVAGRDASPSGRRSAATTRPSRRTPACSPPATSWAPTSPWSPRGRATSAPAPAGATPGWPAPTPCTPPTCSAAAGSRRCACREPTAASGTAASATTAARRTAGPLLTPADVPVTTLPDAELDALVRAQLAELVGTRPGGADRGRGAGRRAARRAAHLTGGPDDDGAGSG